MGDNTGSTEQSHLAGVASGDSTTYIQNFGAHRPGISHEDMVEYYNNWASDGQYEKDLHPGLYRGPLLVADGLARWLPQEKRERMRILDVAAGTGYVGHQLKLRGFRNVDALDPASEMLERARERGCYSNFICDKLGGDTCDISNDTYDAVVTSGGMGEGHIPCTGVLQMAQFTKPGGFVCIMMREEYLSEVSEYKGRLETLFQKMEDAGIWKKMERTRLPCYSFQKTGVLSVFKVLTTGCPMVGIE